MKLWRVLFAIGMFCLFVTHSLHADEALKVGIKLYDPKLPPEQRQPRGFSIDLWNAIAQSLGKKTEWVYYNTMPELIDAAQSHGIDAGISAITVTTEREDKVDFSNSMYELGLQIMVSADASPNPWLVALGEIGKFFTWQVLLVLLGLVLIFAHLRWLVDRRSSDGDATFPADYRHGITEAAWWSLTMFVTWDTPPRRGLARIVDLLWFLMGFLCLGILSSVITAALTEQNINSSIQGVHDLLDKRVAAVETDAPRAYLERLGIDIVPVKDLQEGVQKVAKGEVDALVHDGPRLQYLATLHNQSATEKAQVNVLPASFNPQIYGIAFPSHSPWLEPVNHALMQLREAQGLNDSVYEGLRKKWLPE